MLSGKPRDWQSSMDRSLGDRHRFLRSGANRSGNIMLSATVPNGSKLNCWNTTPICSARNRSRDQPDKDFKSVPPKATFPLSARIVPQIIESSVDFPEPLSPSKRTDSPFLTKNSGTVRTNDVRPGQLKRAFSNSITQRSVTVRTYREVQAWGHHAQFQKLEPQSQIRFELPVQGHSRRFRNT